MREMLQTIQDLTRLKGSARSSILGMGRLLKNKAVEDRLVAHMRDSVFSEIWSLVSDHVLIDVFRAKQIYDSARTQLGKPGDFMECGVAGGGTSLMLALLLEREGSDKRVWCCDSFEGLPAPDRQFDKEYAPGEFAVGQDKVESLLEEHGVRDRCVLVPGWFQDTLSNLDPDLVLSLLHIDCDLYRPALVCMAHLLPRVPAGGVVVFDDYLDGSDGMFQALNAHALKVNAIIRVGPTGQASVVQDETEGPPVFTLKLNATGSPDPDGHPIRLSYVDIVNNETYLAYLAMLRDDLQDRADELTAQLALLR
jgi:hypothetical protein